MKGTGGTPMARSGVTGFAEVLGSGTAGIYRLDPDIPIPGYAGFITPWLVLEGDRSVLLDPGPACGIPSLLGMLRDLGISRLDYVLLTHVHVDHAGGVADLLAAYPEAKVMAHPRGVPHLIDPTRLQESTISTLGEVGRAYGPIRPLHPASVLPEGEEIDGFVVVDTLGHAPHHRSYVYRPGSIQCGSRRGGSARGGSAQGRYAQDGPTQCGSTQGGSMRVLFSGEAAGVLLGAGYQRPATPPRFVYDVYRKSLDLLAGLGASVVCCGHFGASCEAGQVIERARQQLSLWRTVAAEAVARDSAAIWDGRKGDGSPGGAGALVDRCLERLLRLDGMLAGFQDFPLPVRQREEFFLRNSLKGILDELLSRPD